MHPRKLKQLIQGGETTQVEFKRQTPSLEKIAKEITAMANTKGGYLLIGVEDNKKICGVANEKSEIDRVERACQYYISPPISPNIEVINLLGYEIVVVQINESTNKPLAALLAKVEGEKLARKRIFIRSGEESVLASSGMARLLKDTYNTNAKSKMNLWKREQRLFEYLKANKNITVPVYSKLINISRRRAERMLIHMVRIGLLQIHTDRQKDYYSAIEER